MATLDLRRNESALLKSAASFHMYSPVAHFHLLRVAHSLLLRASCFGHTHHCKDAKQLISATRRDAADTFSCKYHN